MDSLDALYAEWRAHDDAREAREVAKAASYEADGPQEAVEAVQDGICTDIAEIDEAVPRASQEHLGHACWCDHDEELLDGRYISVKTGREYVPMTSPGGISFGWDNRTKFVMLSEGRHTIECGTRGIRRVDILADELASKLQARVKVVEAVKEYLARPEDRAAMDTLLQQFFKRHKKWKVARKYIAKATSVLKFKQKEKDGALRIFNRLAFRRTWEA